MKPTKDLLQSDHLAGNQQREEQLGELLNPAKV
jgi:hypothetical protein